MCRDLQPPREKSGGFPRPSVTFSAVKGGRSSEGGSGSERMSSSSSIDSSETVMVNRLPDNSDVARSSFQGAFLGSRLFLCFKRHIICCFIIVILTSFFIRHFSAYSTNPICPKYWLMYEGKCYLFSDAEDTWNSSQKNCTLYGASLVPLDTPEEMAFVRRYKSRTDYWIGLQREAVGEPWKWANGSDFNNWFKIGADGLCAYLDDDDASSTWCHTWRNWICSKFLHAS